MADRFDVVVVGVREASHARTVQLAAELARRCGMPSSHVQMTLLGGELVVHEGFPAAEADRAAAVLRGLGAEVELRASTAGAGLLLEPDRRTRPTREIPMPEATAVDRIDPDPRRAIVRAPPPPAVGMPTAHVPLAPPPEFATLGAGAVDDAALDLTVDDSGTAPRPTLPRRVPSRGKRPDEPLLDPSRPQGRPEHAEERPFDGSHRRSSRPTPSRVEPLPEAPPRRWARPTPVPIRGSSRPTPSRITELPHAPTAARSPARDGRPAPTPTRPRSRKRDTASQAGEFVTSRTPDPEPTGIAGIDAMMSAASSGEGMLTTLDGETPDSVEIRLGDDDPAPPEPPGPAPVAARTTGAPRTPGDGPRARLEDVRTGVAARVDTSARPTASRAAGFPAPAAAASSHAAIDDDVPEVDFEAAGLSPPQAAGSMAAFEPEPEPATAVATETVARPFLLGRDPIAAVLLGLVFSFAASTIVAYEVMRRTERDVILGLEEELADALAKPLAVQAGKARSPDAIERALDDALDRQRTRFWWVWLGLGLPLGIVLGRVPSSP